MRKLRTGLLVAAATIGGMPAIVSTAQAQPPQGQQDQGRHDHGDRGDHGDRADRGDHGDRADRGGGGGRPDRGNDGRGGQTPQQQPQQQQPQAPRPPQQQPQQQQPGHGPDGRGPGQPGRDGPRGPNGYDPRFGPNAHGGQGGFAGRPDDRGPGWDRGPGRPGFDRGPDRGWNRGPGGWRGDRRYDWHGWRDQHRALFRGPRYLPPRGWGYGYRPFAPGYRLQPFFYERNYWIDDPSAYRLPPAYGPYRWVRYYNDVLLVDLRSGEVVDVIRDFFW